MRFSAKKHWPLLALPLALIAALSARAYLERPIPPDPYPSATYSLIEPDLYVGARTPAPPPHTDAVLNLSFEKDIYTAKSYQSSPIPDAAPAPSLDWLSQQVNFVNTQISQDHQTFIHCDAGYSRSALVATAYLMYQHQWNRKTALAFLQSKRPNALPNPTFMNLLLDYEKSLNLNPYTSSGYVSYANYSQVEPLLYIGGRTPQPPPNTTAVLSLSYQEDLYKVPFHQYSSIPDGKSAPSLDWLQKQVAFVDAQQKAQRTTYIHCDAGMSRSALVTAAYLMYEHHWTRDQALAFLKQKRPVIAPNPYFTALLLDYEKQLAKQNP